MDVRVDIVSQTKHAVKLANRHNGKEHWFPRSVVTFLNTFPGKHDQRVEIEDWFWYDHVSWTFKEDVHMR